jgi:hypothetical protein
MFLYSAVKLHETDGPPHAAHGTCHGICGPFLLREKLHGKAATFFSHAHQAGENYFEMRRKE